MTLPLPWYVQHAVDTGHATRVSIDDPGSCYDCPARAPLADILNPRPDHLTEEDDDHRPDP